MSASRYVDDAHIRKNFIDTLKNTNMLSDDSLVSKGDSDLTLDYDTESIIYHELGLKGNESSSRVDVVADLVYIKDINYSKEEGKPKPKSIGFEIKSDKDTLKRLPKQIEVYAKFFSKTYVITTHKHLPKVIELIKGTNVGVIVYESTAPINEDFKIVELAKERNSDFYGKHWSNLLWLKEIEEHFKLKSVDYLKNPLLKYKHQKKKMFDRIYLEQEEKEFLLNKEGETPLTYTKKVSSYPNLEGEVYRILYKRCIDELSGIKKTKNEWNRRIDEEYGLKVVNSK